MAQFPQFPVRFPMPTGEDALIIPGEIDRVEFAESDQHANLHLLSGEVVTVSGSRLDVEARVKRMQNG